MESQYTQAYLDDAEQRMRRGEKPVTPGTFVCYQLRGRAKAWSGRYTNALVRSLEKRGCKEVESVGGKLAFIAG